MPVHAPGAFPRAEAPAIYRDSAPGSRIDEYRVLKGLRNYEKALEQLRRIGSIVRPIMAKHGWQLPALIEMLPQQQNLLGLNFNQGQKIAIRLRESKEGDFFGEDALIETMLHELTHNVRGPHDHIFDKQLEELTEEWYELRRKGRADGEGFLTPGMRVGMGQALDVPLSKAREVAARNAELRAQRGGGGRLGGSGSADGGSSKDARRKAVEAAEARLRRAAQEREKALKTEGGCPNSQQVQQEAEAEIEEQERINGVLVVTLVDSDSETEDESDDDVKIQSIVRKPQTNDGASRHAAPVKGPPAKVPRLGEASSSKQTLQRPNAPSRPVAAPPKPAPAPAPRPWTCQACTLRNAPSSRACEACETLRPGATSSTALGSTAAAGLGWQCAACSFVMPSDLADRWMCTACGAIKAG